MKVVTRLSLLIFLMMANLPMEAQDSLATYNELMQKSRKQRSAGAIFIGGGSAGLLITALADVTDALGSGISNAFYPNSSQRHSFTAPYLISLAAIGGGTLLLISSAKNKKKAGTFTSQTFFKIENSTVIQPTGYSSQSYPAIGLGWSLK